MSSLVLISGFILATILGVVIFLPINQAKNGVSLFSDPTTLNEYRLQHAAANTNILKRIITSKYIFYTQKVLSNHISAFTPDFLIIPGGTHPWHEIYGWAQFLPAQYLLFLAGLLLIIFKSFKNQKAQWLLLLIFISPLASTITIDAPHVTRSLLLFMLAPMPMAYTLNWFITQKKWGIGIGAIALLFLLINSIQFGFSYFTQYLSHQADTWRTGMKAAILHINDYPSSEPVWFTEYAASPYIYLLFYQQLLPSQYLPSIIYYPKDNAGLIHVKQFTRYHFVSDQSEITSTPPYLLIDQQANQDVKLTPIMQ